MKINLFYKWKKYYSMKSYIKGLFGLTYFRAYAKQLVQINISLCIIYKLFNVVYEKIVYEGTNFVSENL